MNGSASDYPRGLRTRMASAVGASCSMLDGLVASTAPARFSGNIRAWPFEEPPSRALHHTHVYDELRRPRPLDIILPVAGGCSSGAHGKHHGEWRCIETYVFCDLDLLDLSVVGP